MAAEDLIVCTYEVDGVQLTGYLADGATGRAAPGVLLAHEAPGVSDHVKARARMLAKVGYVAFALDMYGQANLPLEAAREHSQRLMADSTLMRRRARAALGVLASHTHCDDSKIAVAGFCLGGVVALELARDQAPIKCAVGFHPSFKRPIGSVSTRLVAKVLMMIGDDDPIAPPEDRSAFAREMKGADADWQLHVFGGVGHSYTNRDIDALGYPGFAYNRDADRRAWSLMLALFDEVFADEKRGAGGTASAPH
jgi:dienelactone hydrolase